MLVRATLVRVPPFSQRNCRALAEHYPGARSFKDAMKHLEGGSQPIADGHLESQILARDSLPTANKIDFKAGIDALLAELE